MHAPDASGAESLAPQGAIEIGNHLFGQVGQLDVPNGGENVIVDQIAAPALGVAAPFAAVSGKPLAAPLPNGKVFFFLHIIASLSANDNITESRK